MVFSLFAFFGSQSDSFSLFKSIKDAVHYSKLLQQPEVERGGFVASDCRENTYLLAEDVFQGARPEYIIARLGITGFPVNRDSTDLYIIGAPVLKLINGIQRLMYWPACIVILLAAKEHFI